jgi:NADPH:quinone reductase-like Zn-dependent oxidoreductase
MYAAVVRSFDQPPHFEQYPAPTAAAPHEEVVDVIAAGLHPRVRSQADGSHYTATDELPLIPGIDGVGRRADGSLVYFVLPDTTVGAMAEQTVIDRRRSIPLPADADPVLLAAAMNPAMSSWVALTRRIDFAPGQSVLVLGATGSAGRLAIQIARHLGARHVVAAGRGTAKLAALDADATIDLSADSATVAREVAEKAAEVDVVLDYLWGTPTELTIMPLLRARSDPSRLLSWIEIGAAAGPDIALPSAALRQANVHFLGSGQGSTSGAGILESLPELVDLIGQGTFSIETATRSLRDVEKAWTAPPTTADTRIVITP